MSLFRNVMYDHKLKPWCIGLACAGATAMVAERVHGFVIFSKLNADEHFYIFQWVMLFGLMGIIFCREKHEDDRAKAIRGRAFQVAFVLQQAMLLGVSLSGSLGKSMLQIPASNVFLWSAEGIFVYLFVFYIGINFDFLVPFDNEDMSAKNVSPRQAGWGMLLFVTMMAFIVLLAMFFGEK